MKRAKTSIDPQWLISNFDKKQDRDSKSYLIAHIKNWIRFYMIKSSKYRIDLKPHKELSSTHINILSISVLSNFLFTIYIRSNKTVRCTLKTLMMIYLAYCNL